MQGFLKVALGFYQVLSSFLNTFAVQWPETMRSSMQFSAVSRLDMLAIPGPHCVAEQFTYSSKLVAYTTIPMFVVLALAFPVWVTMFWGRLQYKGWKNHPAFETMINVLWQNLILWVIVVYPTVSVATLQSFNCHRLGSLGSFLTADYSEDCPWNDVPGFVFMWSSVHVFIYPLGIPLLLWFVMVRAKIPHMAQEKKRKAIIQAFIEYYRRETSTTSTTAEMLVRNLHDGQFDGSQKTVIQLNQMKKIFCEIDTNNLGKVSQQKLVEYFTTRVHTVDEQFLEDFLARFDLKHDEEVALDNFVLMMEHLVQKATKFTGFEKLESLTRRQMKTLCSHFHTDDLFVPQESGEHSSGHQYRSRENIVENMTQRELQEEIVRLAFQMYDQRVISIGVLGWDGQSGDHREVIAVRRMGCLFEAYEVDSWFFELIEMGRKLIMTSVLVFIYPGSPNQLVAGFTVSFMSLLMTMRTKPFVNPLLENLQVLALFQLCVTIFYGLNLLLHYDSGNYEEQTSLGYAVELGITVGNCSIAAYPIVQVLLGNARIKRLLQTLVKKYRQNGHTETDRKGLTQQKSKSGFFNFVRGMPNDFKNKSDLGDGSDAKWPGSVDVLIPSDKTDIEAVGTSVVATDGRITEPEGERESRRNPGIPYSRAREDDDGRDSEQDCKHRNVGDFTFSRRSHPSKKNGRD